MSHNVKNVNASAPIQKYCKVCHDAGKSEAEYRSHFIRETRDPSSKITCPTLLALECRYCYKNGHTVKYCPVLKDKEKHRKRKESSARRIEAQQKTEVKPKGKSTKSNVFDCLDSDSEEEVVVQKPVKEEFPVLCEPVLTRTQSVSMNYAAVLSKPVAIKPVQPKQYAIKEVIVYTAEQAEANAKAEAASTYPKASTMKSWADWSDSEDEDDNYSVHSSTSQIYDSDW